MSGPDRKAIGLFNRGNITVEKFKDGNPTSPQTQELSLVRMTNKAVELLANGAGSRNGFFLQEGALIDKRRTPTTLRRPCA